MEEMISACTLDCPDGCSFLVKAAGGIVEEIKGNPHHPITRGFICPRPSTAFEAAGGSNRILYPAVNSGGTRKRISWQEALDLIGGKMAPVMEGKGSGLIVQGHGTMGITRFAVRYFFRRLGFLELYGGLCDEAGIEAFHLDTGGLEMSDPREILHSSGIVLWGKMPTASSPHTAHLVRMAHKAGVPLAVISPCRTPFSKEAVPDIRIRPGEDASLAAMVSRILLEKGDHWTDAGRKSENFSAYRRMIMGTDIDLLAARSDVGRDEAEALAEFLMRNSPVSILIGQGLQRYRHGCTAVRAINALAFLSGNIGKRGAGAFYNLPSSRNLNLGWMPPSPEGRISLPQISRDLPQREGTIDFAWISATNFVNQCPDSIKVADAFKKIPFTVVVDTTWNDTAENANLVLPAAMMLERTDITTTFGHDFLALSRSIVEPRGEALSDFDIIMKLSEQINLDLPWSNLDEYFSLVLDSPFLDGAENNLKKKGYHRAKRPLVAYRGAKFPREGGKFRFLDSILFSRPDSEYPLYFITTVQARYQHSQTPISDQDKPLPVKVHPDTAHKLGLVDGGNVFIKSELGIMPAVLKADDGLHPEVVIAPRGGWLKTGRCVNALIAPHVSLQGHCAAFYQQKVTLIPE